MEKTFETRGDVRLYVENEVGHVAITTGPSLATTVSLEPETADAEQLVERATVECHTTGGSRHMVVVKVPRQGMRFLRRNPVTVRVDLPEGSDVNVMAGSADVDITGPVGAAELATSSGDISADDVAGDFDSKTASGDIIVGAVGGDLKVHSASGDLRCTSVAGRAVFATASGDLEVGAAAGQVDVKATSGDVRLGDLAHGARVQNVSGDVRVLALGEGTLHVRSVSGSVSVGVVTGVDLHVDVETMSGQIRSDIPLGDQRGPGGRDNSRVEVSVRSVSGDVEIERALEQVA
ncbi:MAG TPA: DUF4097 family beta strand repeat-containing protein [Acidimicrobiales bacterium]|nr:DUF4097 family beta strand repeat-containing protein [Acidimicrobiales bacterium]